MKKCIVLDLDNTLWGGIVGEDGMENLHLSVKAPGNSFLAFQQALLDLYHRGVILAINSRNNFEDAMQVIRNHPNMLLKENHFAAHRINWEDKAKNIRELAQELNIGLDSMVFLDDDQTNRDLVRALVPEVDVPELPADPKLYTQFLNSLTYFPTQVVTNEDAMRGNLYTTERLRKEEEGQHASKEDFLKSLNLELQISKNDKENIPRLAQLTEKTNQFNVKKTPYTEEEVLAFIESDTHDVYHGQLVDRYGDYGIIVLAIIKKEEKVWHIDTLLMSCRVFGRGVEDAFLSFLAEKAKSEGVEEIHVAFSKSEKNAPAEEFIKKAFKDFTLKIEEVPVSPEWVKIMAK